ncbi:MAG TPA: iron chelate uptake ABC transporter family permease subunit, partial [Vicinamibacteria bacterium]|nr:iron chelate uptake ABC transporter family permease subunit [Vicinamibacteria bacterium]
MSDRPRPLLLPALAAALPLVLLAALSLGAVTVSPLAVLRSALSALGLPARPMPEVQEVIVWSVRLPRVLAAALVGGGLAVVGAS